MYNYSAEELNSLNLLQLKTIAKKLNLGNLKKNQDKKYLVSLILNHLRNEKERVFKFTDNPCSIPFNTCVRTQIKGYKKKEDIIELARRCGVTDFSGTRKDICQRIADKFAENQAAAGGGAENQAAAGGGAEEAKEANQNEDEDEDEDEDENEQTLMKLTGEKLKDMLKRRGIKKLLPTKKDEMVSYLMAQKNENICDIESKKFCKKPLVCDLEHKLCVNKPRRTRGVSTEEINNYLFLGKNKELENVRKLLEKMAQEAEAAAEAAAQAAQDAAQAAEAAQAAAQAAQDAQEAQDEAYAAASGLGVGVEEQKDEVGDAAWVDQNYGGGTDSDSDQAEAAGWPDQNQAQAAGWPEQKAEAASDSESDQDGDVDGVEALLKELNETSSENLTDLNKLQKSILKCLGLL